MILPKYLDILQMTFVTSKEINLIKHNFEVVMKISKQNQTVQKNETTIIMKKEENIPTNLWDEEPMVFVHATAIRPEKWDFSKQDSMKISYISH